MYAFLLPVMHVRTHEKLVPCSVRSLFNLGIGFAPSPVYGIPCGRPSSPPSVMSWSSVLQVRSATFIKPHSTPQPLRASRTHSNIKMFGWFAAHAALNPALRIRSRARIIAQGQAANLRSSRESATGHSSPPAVPGVPWCVESHRPAAAHERTQPRRLEDVYRTVLPTTGTGYSEKALPKTRGVEGVLEFVGENY